MMEIMIIPRSVTVKVVANDSSNRLEYQTRVLRKAIDKHQPKKVGVLMGSPNDYPKMKGAEDVLLRFGLTPDVRVMSAHRQPHEVAEYASKARENDYAAIICGAGMAAHLAGAVSSQTTLPVVGVPLSGSPIEGIDALYSTVQMPKGIPVATVAIDNSTNAAILVAQMLGITNLNLADKIQDFRDETRNTLNDHTFN
jgi:5-(carboxyamino)imidazole ribonucleotide mutase